jgi:hypothetical protein
MFRADTPLQAHKQKEKQQLVTFCAVRARTNDDGILTAPSLHMTVFAATLRKLAAAPACPLFVPASHRPVPALPALPRPSPSILPARPLSSPPTRPPPQLCAMEVLPHHVLSPPAQRPFRPPPPADTLSLSTDLCAMVACLQAVAAPAGGPSWAAAAAARPSYRWRLTAACHSTPRQRRQHHAVHAPCNTGTAAQSSVTGPSSGTRGTNPSAARAIGGGADGGALRLPYVCSS